MNKKIIFGIFLFVLVGSLFSFVSAMKINYYHSPNCGHCLRVNPLIENLHNKYPNVEWTILDVSKKNYKIDGTPTIKIETNDKREITLIGSQEIPRWLECEINEQSNLNCPTYSTNNCLSESWFDRGLNG